MRPGANGAGTLAPEGLAVSSPSGKWHNRLTAMQREPKDNNWPGYWSGFGQVGKHVLKHHGGWGPVCSILILTHCRLTLANAFSVMSY